MTEKFKSHVVLEMLQGNLTVAEIMGKANDFSLPGLRGQEFKSDDSRHDHDQTEDTPERN